MWSPVTWKAKPQARPFQSSDRCKLQCDVLEHDMRHEPQPRRAEATRFSWVTREFTPAIPVAFPPETTPKSLHWFVGVKSKVQSKYHAECPPKRWLQSGGDGSEQMQHFYGQCHCQEARPTYSWLTISLFFSVPPSTSESLGMELFHTLYVHNIRKPQAAEGLFSPVPL